MNDVAGHDAVLCDYLDALLEPSPRLPATATDVATPAWRLCTLGRLQLLLPDHALGAAIACASLVQAPNGWHLARVRIDETEWHVAELVRCIAPGMAAVPVETLIPVTGSGWMLGVPGRPQPLSMPADTIQWRPHRTSRAWLAGMSRDGRFMALDVHTLVAQAGETLDAGMEGPTP
ncbi:MAG: hypothetical protein J0H27_02850 [Xanthomonadales bacterium]|nr:hypothetical protein [Xanthomonadales bacterium]ODU95303.1 MAG: hypothetical protein ABT18_00835 [Rhodanobacter sp. SCN 66-43]OJY83029.1 MAG: hypothetical protein BGP23_08140 [Xanthomonadales bacterium 66-474]